MEMKSKEEIWDFLMTVQEGAIVSLVTDGTDHTRSVSVENSVNRIIEDPGGFGGEIQRHIFIGPPNPRDEGLMIDMGDTSKNQLVAGGTNEKYIHAWRFDTSKGSYFKNRYGVGDVVAIDETMDVVCDWEE